MYIYIHICTCIYIYICVCVYLYIYMCVCIYIYTRYLRVYGLAEARRGTVQEYGADMKVRIFGFRPTAFRA